jgi:hypothetical protein
MLKRDMMVRVPTYLIEKIQPIAEKNQRTIPKQIEHLLIKALEKESP